MSRRRQQTLWAMNHNHISQEPPTHTPEAFVQVVPLLSEGCLRRALLPPASAQSTSLARIRIASPSAFALRPLALLSLVSRIFRPSYSSSPSPPSTSLRLPVSLPSTGCHLTIQDRVPRSVHAHPAPIQKLKTDTTSL